MGICGTVFALFQGLLLILQCHILLHGRYDLSQASQPISAGSLATRTSKRARGVSPTTTHISIPYLKGRVESHHSTWRQRVKDPQAVLAWHTYQEATTCITGIACSSETGRAAPTKGVLTTLPNAMVAHEPLA
jgi:hypothetical protein